MRYRHGIPVSPGVATGPGLVVGNRELSISVRFVQPEVAAAEVTRFEQVLEQVCQEIGQSEQVAAEKLGKQHAAIFRAHQSLIRDPKLTQEITGGIREMGWSAEMAVDSVFARYIRTIRALDSDYFAERAVDLHDLKTRLMRALQGASHVELGLLEEPAIILAHSLTPSETAALDRRFVLGFATETGGRTSHTAILAGALGIPAVVGIGPFLSDLAGTETVVVNGQTGELVIDPDETTLEHVRASETQIRTHRERLQSIATEPGRLDSGEEVTVLANIEFPEESEQAIANGAEGIGLYRTEFLYLGHNSGSGRASGEPTEDDHIAAYRQVFEAFPGQPVTIRTFDLGADKLPASFRSGGSFTEAPCDSNLGLRSIRYSLKNLQAFKTQLRAILLAADGLMSVPGGDAADGTDHRPYRGSTRKGELTSIRIMFPLVSTVLEFRQAKMILLDVAEDLEDEGLTFPQKISVGMMIEVPSAALLADRFAEEADFFSIGTNDLIQYTLACDRTNSAVANLYRSSDPAILQLLRMVADAGERSGTPVSVCGQMGSDPLFVPLLVGMGLRHLSVTPHAIPEVKEILRNLSLGDAQAIAERAFEFELARDVESFLRGELDRICPGFAV